MTFSWIFCFSEPQISTEYIDRILVEIRTALPTPDQLNQSTADDVHRCVSFVCEVTHSFFENIEVGGRHYNTFYNIDKFFISNIYLLLLVFFKKIIIYTDSFGDLLPPVSATMDTLPPVSSDELFNVIMASPSKSCGIDPLQTTLLKTSVAPLLPFLTNTMNKSMSTGVVPHAFKVAQVSPKLKKACLNQNILGNYRPISNLTFLSEVLERVVAACLVTYLEENNLPEPNQSAYRKGPVLRRRQSVRQDFESRCANF